MVIVEAPATRREIRRKFATISVFALHKRKIARNEAANGAVQVISFTVSRAWKLFTCTGSPCCANEWLLETAEGGFVQLGSWDDLSETEAGHFPGTRVTVRRWPVTKRLIAAAVEGQSIAPEATTPESWAELANQAGQCDVFRRDTLPGRRR